MGSNFEPDELVNRLLIDIDAMMPDDGRLPSANLRTLEGFVLGWSIISLALDMNPEIAWEKYIKLRLDSCRPTELEGFIPMPRFELYLDKVEINEIREETGRFPGEEPYLWIIPIIIERGSDVNRSRIITTCYGRIRPLWPPSAKAGDKRTIKQSFVWGVDQRIVSADFILVIVGWEKDFTEDTELSRGFSKTVSVINQRLNEWQDPQDPTWWSPYRFSQHLEEVLNSELPYLYPSPEARQGCRKSDDDFVGVSVTPFSVYAETSQAEIPIVTRIKRTPKPKPKFTEMTVYCKLSFKNPT